MREDWPCAKCPKRDGFGVCVIRGVWVSPLHPSCAYGREMMRIVYMSMGYSAFIAGAEARQPEGMEKGARHGTA